MLPELADALVEQCQRALTLLPAKLELAALTLHRRACACARVLGECRRELNSRPVVAFGHEPGSQREH